ncbi:unnamed protein product [Allacma fusca]|uniref:Uncharacterized protein n=1 Tax=Allacma fusca TaxID=39272 RepID=A0A8J2K3N5_9HEXA|nr:unnamed protein product [Allacma fusca]
MLTKYDLRYHWWSIRFFSNLCFYPLQMDRKTNRIRIQQTIWKRLLHCLHLLVWLAYTLMVVYRIGEIISKKEEHMLMLLACPVGCIGLSFMAITAHICMFFVRPQFYIHGFNRILDYLSGIGIYKHTQARPRHEWFAIFIVQLNAFMPVAHLMVFLGFPDATNFVYYNVPEERKTPLVFMACASVELYVFGLWSVTAAFLLFIGVLNIHMSLEQMDDGIVNSKSICFKGIKGDEAFALIEKQYKNCRELQLAIQEVNRAYSFLVLVARIYFLYECILCSFSGLRMWNVASLVGLSFLLFGLNSTAMYVLTFERAFKIPLKMEEYKLSIKESAGVCLGGGSLISVVSRMVDSIPCVAIKVGPFNSMERASPIIFFHFVVSGIVNLLLAFQ